mgnify:FL=1
MKKKFLIGSLLPVLAGMAVVGSGFSLWFFNNTTTTEAQNNLNKDVTQLVEIGTITVADNFTVVFDQKTRTNDLANAGLAANGIYVDFGSNTNKVAKYNRATDGEDIIADSTKVVFTTKIELTNGLDALVKVAYKTSDSATKDFTYDGTSHSFSYVLEFDSTIANDAMVFDWEKVVLTYVNEPKNKTEYEEFKTKVTAAETKINVTYTATLTGVKA